MPPRWRIEARTITVAEGTAHDACRLAVRWAHRDAGVPPWRGCLRRSLAYATATPLEPELMPAPAIAERLAA